MLRLNHMLGCKLGLDGFKAGREFPSVNQARVSAGKSFSGQEFQRLIRQEFPAVNQASQL